MFDLIARFENLKEPVALRRQRLEDSLKWHQYNFDADNEQQWIKDHLPAANSTDYGKSLIDAQNLNKKHQVLRYIFIYIYIYIYIYIRAALTTHKLEWLEPWGKLAELELKFSNRELGYVWNTNVTQST